MWKYKKTVINLLGRRARQNPHGPAEEQQEGLSDTGVTVH